MANYEKKIPMGGQRSWGFFLLQLVEVPRLDGRHSMLCNGDLQLGAEISFVTKNVYGRDVWQAVAEELEHVLCRVDD